MKATQEKFSAGRTFSGVAVAVLVAAVLLGVSQTASARNLPDFASLAEKAMPAVVSISVIGRQAQARGSEIPEAFRNLPFPRNPYRDFFERRWWDEEPPDSALPTSFGSGFVIDRRGYVVTNHHVIEDASKVIVQFSGRQEFEAEIVGTDAKTDIALLKIDSDDPLPYLEFGDSDKSRVGDWIMVIGNPFGLGGSVSAGIISARNRDINASSYDDFIQTDAAVNRGNSGGPLIDLNGKIIGVNTAIISPSGGSSGVAFAVPSRIVSLVVDQIKEYGRTQRGWLGVQIQSLTDDLLDPLGLENTAGALVADVQPNSPAEEAGIQTGDVILTFDGKEVEIMRDLPWMVAQTKVGRRVMLKIWRNEKIRTIPVEIGLLEEEEEKFEEVPVLTSTSEDLGMSYESLQESNRESYGINEGIQGVLVTDVLPDGPAERAGIQPGQVILEINRQLVRSPADIMRLVGEARVLGRQSALALVHDGRGSRYIGLRVGG